MNFEFDVQIWPVGALCRSVADILEARFNPIRVKGEISGLTRPASGHVYFTLKDEAGQLRCAMFRRAASQLDFVLHDGDQVEVQGRLDVYPQRGDLQLVVEGVRQAGQGLLFELFLRRKQLLTAQGVFDAARKRPLARYPRAVGLVTSLSAAALQDVVTSLQRRSPHVPVIIAPAAVQGELAAQELVSALRKLYQLIDQGTPLDVILLVRGGGSMEDLWCFNDEALVHAVVASPVPVVTGVGHETDFTLVDFSADLRAPTPTAAAELAVPPIQMLSEQLEGLNRSLYQTCRRRLDQAAQELDRLALLLGQLTGQLSIQRLGLQRVQMTLQTAIGHRLQQRNAMLGLLQNRLENARQRAQDAAKERLTQAGLRLELLDPARTLQRGYAWLQDSRGQALTSVNQVQPDQRIRAVLHDGVLELSVLNRELN